MKSTFSLLNISLAEKVLRTVNDINTNRNIPGRYVLNIREVEDIDNDEVVVGCNIESSRKVRNSTIDEALLKLYLISFNDLNLNDYFTIIDGALNRFVPGILAIDAVNNEYIDLSNDTKMCNYTIDQIRKDGIGLVNIETFGTGYQVYRSLNRNFTISPDRFYEGAYKAVIYYTAPYVDYLTNTNYYGARL